MPNPIDLGLGLVAFARCMWYPMLRSWRSVVLVALAFEWAAIARTMPVPIDGLALITGWVITLGLVLSNDPVLWVMPVRDQLLVQRYQACVDQLGTLWGESGTREARRYLDGLNRCTDCFASLDTRESDWSGLRDEVVADLRDRAELVRNAGTADKAEMQRRWDAHQTRFLQVQRKHMSFWLPWPWR